MSLARDFDLTAWQMGHTHHGVNAVTPEIIALLATAPE